MLTNNLNLPRSIVAAVTNDPYTKGHSDISVTTLIQPPYLRKLRESGVEIVEDVSDRIWSLIRADAADAAKHIKFISEAMLVPILW